MGDRLDTLLPIFWLELVCPDHSPASDPPRNLSWRQGRSRRHSQNQQKRVHAPPDHGRIRSRTPHQHRHLLFRPRFLVCVHEERPLLHPRARPPRPGRSPATSPPLPTMAAPRVQRSFFSPRRVRRHRSRLLRVRSSPVLACQPLLPFPRCAVAVRYNLWLL